MGLLRTGLSPPMIWSEASLAIICLSGRFPSYFIRFCGICSSNYIHLLYTEFCLTFDEDVEALLSAETESEHARIRGEGELW